MKEIDEVIEKHGGWPGAFSTSLASEPLPTSTSVADESEPSVRAYGVADESLHVAAEADVSSGHGGKAADFGKVSESMLAKNPQIESAAENGLRSIDDIDQSEIMAAIRQVFNDAAARDRETAMRDIAHELGFDRTGSRIQERLNGELIAAARRMIVANNKGDLTLGSRSIEDYSREYLKTLFLSDMGSTWWDREDAINRAARYLGFTRTGARIYDSFKSIINGLLRDGKLESDPDKGIRRA